MQSFSTLFCDRLHRVVRVLFALQKNSVLQDKLRHSSRLKGDADTIV